MSRYDCLFFDLDRTLWDVDLNQKEAMRILYGRYSLERFGAGFDECFALYSTSNARLWEEYRDGKVSRETLRNTRFVEMLRGIGSDDLQLACTLSDEYIRLAPTYTNLIPHAMEVVRTLSERYPLHIITNGFVEVQHIKLRNCGLGPYFRSVVCSEQAGANKPSPVIFEAALREAGVAASRVLMIGDDPQTDLLGAARSGIDSVWFNPSGEYCDCTPTYEIRALTELPEML